MKSASRLNVRVGHEDKFEMILLQRENKNLREQLKEFSSRLNELILIKDTKGNKKVGNSVNPEDELREVNKMIEIYKKEKKSLAFRLRKAMDLDFYNHLTEKVEKQQQVLAYYESSKKNNELIEKKETLYRQSPTKMLDTPSELNYLNNKKHHYKTRIQEMQENLEKSSKSIQESQRKLEQLEKEHKDLLEDLGEPYFRQLSMKKLQKTVNKKKKVEQLILKETNSKVMTMQHKIKSLQSELKSLKENESDIYFKVLDVSKQAESYSQKIRKSPIFTNKNQIYDIRSRSVKPQIHDYYTQELNY